MVDNIIYRLESENFRLEFNPIIHENDLAFPVNTSLNIKVFSYGFSADSVMDVDVRGLAGFAMCKPTAPQKSILQEWRTSIHSLTAMYSCALRGRAARIV